MKKKVGALIFAITLLTTHSFSQTTREKVDKQIRDPKTAENSGKADVYVQKKMINDSLLAKKDDQLLTEKKKYKRTKYCKKG